jgi:predicted DNA-binding protein with PD1-like motif
MHAYDAAVRGKPDPTGHALSLAQPLPGAPARGDADIAMRYAALRLLPGADLLDALKAYVAARDLDAVVIISAVGSLGRATLRYAAAESATIIERPQEIVALSGTVTRDAAHVHGAVSDAFGAVTGGHLLAGCEVRQGVELVLGEIGTSTN